MVKQTRLMPRTFNLKCEIWSCTNRADYTVRREDTSNGDTFSLCEECSRAMLDNLPIELQQGGGPRQEDVVQGQAPTEEDRTITTVPLPDYDRLPKNNPPNISTAQMEQEVSTPEEPEPATSGEESNVTMPLDDHKQTEEQEEKQEQENEDEQIADRINQLHENTVDELSKTAKQLEIPRYYDMKKDDLVEAIVEKEQENGR